VPTLQDAIAAAAAGLAAVAGRQVTVVRGAESCTPTAVKGRSEFQIDSETGTQIEHSDADFLIAAADYDFGSGPLKPARGDRISEVVGMLTFQYEVMAPGNGQPFQFRDADRTQLRIHCKLISES